MLNLNLTIGRDYMILNQNLVLRMFTNRINNLKIKYPHFKTNLETYLTDITEELNLIYSSSPSDQELLHYLHSKGFSNSQIKNYLSYFNQKRLF